MNRTSFVVLGVLFAASLLAAFTLLPVNAQQSVEGPDASAARFNVATEVLPGHLSMTLFYITDAKTNKLHIYRARGGMDTSFRGDPELYRSYDLTSVGEKNLRQAK